MEAHDRVEYEAYVNKNKLQTYKEGIEFEKLNTTMEQVLNKSVPFIFTLDFEETYKVSYDPSPGPYLPVWQSYTFFVTNFLYTNFNLLQGNRINNTFWTTYSTKIPSVEVVTIPNPQNPKEYTVESQIMQPVFETVYDPDNDPKPPKIVGAVWLALDWITYFQVRNTVFDVVSSVRRRHLGVAVCRRPLRRLLTVCPSNRRHAFAILSLRFLSN